MRAVFRCSLANPRFFLQNTVRISKSVCVPLVCRTRQSDVYGECREKQSANSVVDDYLIKHYGGVILALHRCVSIAELSSHDPLRGDDGR